MTKVPHFSSRESEVYYEFEVHVTRVPHTAKISNVNRVMLVNRIGEMVFFNLFSSRAWDKKHLSLPSSKLTISLILFTNMNFAHSRVSVAQW